MALVPLEGEPPAADAKTMQFTDRQVQQAGVRVGRVMRRTLVREIDTVGEIAFDERRLARVTAWVGGRIETLHVNVTGERVEAGDPLVELYSASLVVAVEQLQEAKRALERLRKDNGSAEAIRQAADLVASTRVLLHRKGLTSEQIAAIELDIDAGNPPLGDREIPTITLSARQSGIVVQKRVEEGAYVKEGTELLRIADLSVVWLNVAIYENDLPFVTLGTPVEATTRALPGRTFTSTVAFIDPVVDPKTRTIRVRVDLPNPDGELKPGMFARVTLRQPLPDVLAVPESAVLHSGRRQIALVREEGGHYRPTTVRLGRSWLYPEKPAAPRTGTLDFALDEHERYHEVLAGLSNGDTVVVAGAFLLAAEAQFQGLLKKLAQAPEPDGGSETRSPVTPPDRPPSATPMRAQMSAVLAAYYAVGDSLANDQADGAGYGKIAAAAGAVELPDDASDRAAMEKVLAAVRSAATSGAAADAILEQRRAYGLLSDALIEYVRRFTRPAVEAGQIFGHRCGMAGSMYQIPSEDWLQPARKRRNPYMGQAMPG